MEALHYLLMKSYTMLNRRILSKVVKDGYSPGQPKVLECLSRQDGRDQKSIARYCEIEPATVGGILLRMEQAGLIERRRLDGNRRSLFVYLTEKGQGAAAEIMAVLAEADEYAQQALTPTETEDLNRLLEKLIAHFEKTTGEPQGGK